VFDKGTGFRTGEVIVSLDCDFCLGTLQTTAIRETTSSLATVAFRYFLLAHFQGLPRGYFVSPSCYLGASCTHGTYPRGCCAFSADPPVEHQCVAQVSCF
jgi:hypothetical protein